MNTVTVEIGPRMVFPKEGRSHEFEPDFTYFDNRYNSLLQKAWENDIQVCLPGLAALLPENGCSINTRT